jgi:hypothetical protein
MTISSFIRKRVGGIEPPSLAWKAKVLPLNYTRTGTFPCRLQVSTDFVLRHLILQNCLKAYSVIHSIA